MLFYDLFTAFITGFWVIVIHPDKIGTEGAMVIRICFSVRYRIKLTKSFPPARRENPSQQLVVFRVIMIGFRKRHTIIRMVTETHPEAIRLYTMIALSIRTRILR